MKKINMKLTIFFGVLCTLLLAVSSWYTINYNDSRFIVPLDVSEYIFRVQDLPMIISGILLTLYILYLFVLLIRVILVNKQKERTEQITRRINPKMGFLGFLGFLGFFGFWTYSIDKTVFPFTFFTFFGFFGFFYEGKLSNTLMDERYRENRMKAHLTANRVALSIIFIAILILGQGRVMVNLEYTLIAFVIAVVFSLALDVFLSEYLLYHYEHDEKLDESEE